MEGNVCGVNQLDSDVLLPPRKRLLACFKRQNSDVNGNPNSNGTENSNSNSLSECNVLDRIDTRISFLLKAHLSSENPSQEEIVEASRTAAEVAAKVALAARAAAQEKAVIAAKGMACAKKALELVASFDDGGCEIPSFGEQLKKSKAKKQVDVQMLYDNRKPGVEKGKANDEELARKLHHAINSCPRISKGGVPSDVKNHKHKKLKTSESGRISNGSIVGNEKEVDNIAKSNMGNGSNVGNRSNVGNGSNMGNGSNIRNGSNVGNGSNIGNGSKMKLDDDDVTTLGRKRGRMKQKKLPLSICHDRDQATPKEDVTSRSPLSVGPSASERGQLWNCQAFKAPACVKQNKVMHL